VQRGSAPARALKIVQPISVLALTIIPLMNIGYYLNSIAGWRRACHHGQ
jgi:hypothetical protein